MAEVKWIKITTGMFEDEKIDFIESLPESDAILIIWIKLLTLAGKCNTNGFIFLTENIPYNEDMLAHRFRRPTNTVKLALKTLSELNMITFNDEVLKITNWEKHQNIDGLDKIREQTRKRVAKHRAKQPQISNVTGSVTVTDSNAIDIEEEGDVDIEEDIDTTTEKIPAVPYEKIKDMFNSICVSYSKIRTVSAKRKEHIRARYKQYEHSLAIFEELFTKAEESTFLKGENQRGWKADFDWLINDNSMAKVLEGRYEKTIKETPKEASKDLNKGTDFGKFEQHEYKDEELERLFEEI